MVHHPQVDRRGDDKTKGFFIIKNDISHNSITGTGMKAEQWLKRADHELILSQELLNAGSFLWAVSYAHRALEYGLEGLIVMKTGVRPERGLLLGDLYSLAHEYIPGTMTSVITDFVKITPLVWQSDISADQISFLTDKRVKELTEGANNVFSWIIEEWKKDPGSDPVCGADQ